MINLEMFECICQYVPIISTSQVMESINSMKYCNAHGCFDELVGPTPSQPDNTAFVMTISILLGVTQLIRIKQRINVAKSNTKGSC